MEMEAKNFGNQRHDNNNNVALGVEHPEPDNMNKCGRNVPLCGTLVWVVSL